MTELEEARKLLKSAQEAQINGELEKASELYKQYYIKRPSLSAYQPAGSPKKNIKKPRLSIIVPCHNSATYIEQCVDSILSQEFIDFELIIIDDGSSDNSLALIINKAIQDDRIVIISNRQPSGSAGLPRNQALEIAKGELIGFVDSDDWVEPSYFKSLVEALDRTNADIAVSQGFINEMDGSSAERSYPEKWQIKASDSLVACTHMSSMIWDKVYKRKLLEDHDIRLGSYPAAVDVPFILKAYFYCKKPTVVATKGYHYRRETKNSVTVRFRKGSSCDFELKAYKDIFDWSNSCSVPFRYLNYMHLKRFASFVYTCKLVRLDFYLSYFNRCREILLQSKAEEFKSILVSSGQKHLVKTFDLFMDNKPVEFARSQRNDDMKYFLKDATNNSLNLSRSIHLGVRSSHGRERNLVFFPDWSFGNPYQKLFYKALQNSEKYNDLNVIGFRKEEVQLCNFLQILKDQDIIHIHWAHPFIQSDDQTEEFCEVLRQLKIQRKVTIVWTIHNILSHECNDREKELSRRTKLATFCDYYIVHSQNALKQVSNLYKVNSSKISIIPHGKYELDLEKLYKYIDQFNSTRKRMRLLIFGELRSYKRVEWAVKFIEYLNKNVESDKAIELRLAGKAISHEQANFLEKYSQKFDYISLNLKRLSEDELMKEIAQCDFVFTPYSEILTSGVCLNAISHGKPFIAPKFDSLKELWKENRCYLYENESDLKQILNTYNKLFQRKLLSLVFDYRKIISDSDDLEWSSIFRSLTEDPFTRKAYK